MTTRGEQSLARTRNEGESFPGGPSAQQIKTLGVQMANDIQAQSSPPKIAAMTAKAIRDLAHRLSAILDKIAVRIGPLEQGVGSAVIGPASSTESALARWDRVTGRLLKDTPGGVLTDRAGTIELTLEDSSVNSVASLILKNDATQWRISLDGGVSDRFYITEDGIAFPFIVDANAPNASFRIDSSGNIIIAAGDARIADDLSVGTGLDPDERLDVDGALALVDGMTAPGTTSGKAKIYVDSADGDLKVKFGDGTVKTIATDT